MIPASEDRKRQITESSMPTQESVKAQAQPARSLNSSAARETSHARPKTPIVHIVEGDERVRQSLALVTLGQGWAPRVYRSAEALLQERSSLNTGCIITELMLPGMDGITLLQTLRSNGVSLPIVIATAHANVPLAVRALQKGAFHLIEKPYAPAEIVGAIRAGFDLEARQERMRISKAEAEARLARLTPREAEVFWALILGQSSKEIARDLGISPRTVEVYRANIMVKTGAGSLPDLVRLALEVRSPQPSLSHNGAAYPEPAEPVRVAAPIMGPARMSAAWLAD
jgi:two-component system, LuxR family, response regulator FixJ